MKDYESPIDFIYKTKIEQVEIEFKETHEIAQGGPLIGFLFINNKKIYDYEFGGPYLYDRGNFFTPVYVKDSVWGFKLAQINIQELSITILGNIKNLIYLNKIEGNRIFFYQSIKKQVLSYYDF
ncbi:hypothetical protein BH09BAC6_BH09BAC6_17610 [soil metagenome]